MAAGFSFVSTVGECGRGAVSCIGLREDGALSSYFSAVLSRDGDDVSDILSSTVESAFSCLAGPNAADRLRIGTNADLTTSICSSSESSEEFPWMELISSEELILWDMLCDDGGLDEDGRDEAGERRDELR